MSKEKLSTYERLELFSCRVAQLGEMRLVRRGINSQFTIRWDTVSQRLSYHALEPDEEDLRSFLLLFRQFISKKEPVFINRIFSDCLRFLGSDELKDELNKAKGEWKRVLTGMAGFKMVVDSQNLTPEYVLDLWINGEYFHNDPEKARELRRLMTDQIPLVRIQLLSALPSLTQVILYIGNVVTYSLMEGLFHIPDDMA